MLKTGHSLASLSGPGVAPWQACRDAFAESEAASINDNYAIIVCRPHDRSGL